MLAAALTSRKHHTVLCQRNGLCVRLLILLGSILRYRGNPGIIAYFTIYTIKLRLLSMSRDNLAVQGHPSTADVFPCHEKGRPASCNADVMCPANILQVRSERSVNLQVMLAQQESIAQLMSLYEAVSMESQGSSQASQPQLQAVKQESRIGKACLKQDRSACHETWHVQVNCHLGK